MQKGICENLIELWFDFHQMHCCSVQQYKRSYNLLWSPAGEANPEVTMAVSRFKTLQM